jgi:photosystem II stability/assembly factor-like uncharacterized protein
VSDTFQLIVRNVEEPPAGTSATLRLAKNVPWIFSASDFGFSDPLDVPPSALARVKLTTLPAAGVLSVDGAPAAAESFVRLTPSGPGAVWSPRGTNASWWAVCSSDDGNQLAAVVNGARIHTSADAGVTWTPRESNRGWYAIASSADGRRLAAVVQGGLIYTSDDAGVTWVPRGSPRAWRAIASSADGSRLVALDSPGLIYVSSDFGATWAPRESSRAWYSIASSADGTKLAAVVQNGTIFTSDTAGDEWVPRETVRNWRAITSSADGLKLAAIEQNGLIYTSPNAGLTWVGREAARDWHSITSSADGSRLAAVVRDGRNRGATVVRGREDERLGTNICSVSIRVCAKLIRSRSAVFVAPPAAVTASITRAEVCKRYTPGFCTAPVTCTISSPLRSTVLAVTTGATPT